jgi:hypothetical protein
MDITSLQDIIHSYDWREAVSVGIGAGVGIVHGTIDGLQHQRKGNMFVQCLVASGVSGSCASYDPTPPQRIYLMNGRNYRQMSDELVLRSIGNAVLGMVSYYGAYYATQNIVRHVQQRSGSD